MLLSPRSLLFFRKDWVNLSTRTFDTSRGDNSDYILTVFRKDWINGWLVGSSIPPELIKLIIYLLSSERTGLSCCPVGPSIVEARILTSGGILTLCFSISFNTSSRVRVANGAQCRVKRVLYCLTSNVRSHVTSNVRSNVRFFNVRSNVRFFNVRSNVISNVRPNIKKSNVRSNVRSNIKKSNVRSNVKKSPVRSHVRSNAKRLLIG